MKTTAMAVALAAVLTAGGAQAQNVIVNSDFSDALTGWNDASFNHGAFGIHFGSFDVTGGGSGPALRFQTGYQANSDDTIPAGVFVAQSINTTAGELDFSAAIADFNPSAQFGQAGGDVFQALLDGTVMDTVTFGADAPLQTLRDTLSFNTTVSAGDHLVEIKIGRSFFPEADQFVTDVTATQPAVPEPATWGLMLLGFGGIGAVLRARRNAALG